MNWLRGLLCRLGIHHLVLRDGPGFYPIKAIPMRCTRCGVERIYDSTHGGHYEHR